MARRNRGRTKILQVRVTPEEFAKLEQYAELRGTNVTEIVRPTIYKLIQEITTGQPVQVGSHVVHVA